MNIPFASESSSRAHRIVNMVFGEEIEPKLGINKKYILVIDNRSTNKRKFNNNNKTTTLYLKKILSNMVYSVKYGVV